MDVRTPSDLSIADFPERELFLERIEKLQNRYLSLEKRYAERGFPDFEIVKRSLDRFHELLQNSKNSMEFNEAVRREFDFYRADDVNEDEVLFTAYFRPIFNGSRVESNRYRYPLYRMPPNLVTPHPTRKEIERGGFLSGEEIVYLEDPLDAFLAQVQGSVTVQLENARRIYLSFSGATDYPYVSIGGELIRDGKLKKGEASLPEIKKYFAAHPNELTDYLERNNRFVFFREGTPSTKGSEEIELLEGRSLATDKTIYPPGAIGYYTCVLPGRTNDGWRNMRVSRFALDLDAGSAIKGSKRVDLYLGEGVEAGEVAGRVHAKGNLYYLLLKE